MKAEALRVPRLMGAAAASSRPAVRRMLMPMSDTSVPSHDLNRVEPDLAGHRVQARDAVSGAAGIGSIATACRGVDAPKCIVLEGLRSLDNLLFTVLVARFDITPSSGATPVNMPTGA